MHDAFYLLQTIRHKTLMFQQQQKKTKVLWYMSVLITPCYLQCICKSVHCCLVGRQEGHPTCNKNPASVIAKGSLDAFVSLE